MIASLFTSFIATKLGAKLPAWAWEMILAALLIGAGALAHHIAVVHHDNSVRAAQKAADQKQADALVAKLNSLTAKITTPIRSKTDEQATAIHGDAGTLRVSGPGKALCRPAVPGPASGPLAAPAKPDAAGPALPPIDGADVSWGWLTDRAEEHDQLLNETKAWREWYQKLVAAWPKNTGAAAK